jgi:hypothetical protein
MYFCIVILFHALCTSKHITITEHISKHENICFNATTRLNYAYKLIIDLMYICKVLGKKGE